MFEVISVSQRRYQLPDTNKIAREKRRSNRTQGREIAVVEMRQTSSTLTTTVSFSHSLPYQLPHISRRSLSLPWIRLKRERNITFDYVSHWFSSFFFTIHVLHFVLTLVAKLFTSQDSCTFESLFCLSTYFAHKIDSEEDESCRKSIPQLEISNQISLIDDLITINLHRGFLHG